MEREQYNPVNDLRWGTIKGTVQIVRNAFGDDELFTLCCIKVTLLDANNQWVAEESTDDDGHFAFTGVALQPYTIVFPKSIDYQKQRFLPDSQTFERRFPIVVSVEQPVLKAIDIRYAVPTSGALQETDLEDVVASKIA